jgi:hypothetical protein
MSELKKGAKVLVTNINGNPIDSTKEPHFKIVGQHGYVQEVLDHGWVWVKMPEHRFYSEGKGAYLRQNEVELV